MADKKWQIVTELQTSDAVNDIDAIISTLLLSRGMETKSQIKEFLYPKNPYLLTPADVGIDTEQYQIAVKRILRAIKNKESIVVYADYDADGITAGAIMWSAVRLAGGSIMPYIPSRAEEGYGLSNKGIDSVKLQYNPTLLITVDHGITAKDKVAYAQSLGMDVIVTDHHVKPKEVPDCTTVHTTVLCGAGISWFVAKSICDRKNDELLALATIGTIADMVPLTGPNRSITKFGLESLNTTTRVGIRALLQEAGLTTGLLGTYDISHVLAPRLNAMGRLTHAMDALRLLCTTNMEKAIEYAKTLGITNKERQQLTIDTTTHALGQLDGEHLKKLIFISHETYNQGVIGLVAGRLVEEYYRPSVVIARGEQISKASARSIPGFNIVEAIRANSDILIDVGGHPMAAGFTIENIHLTTLQSRLEAQAEREIEDHTLVRTLRIDAAIPLSQVTNGLWKKLQSFEPFGFGNPEPVFASKNVYIIDFRLVGVDGKHLKLKISDGNGITIDAIAFGMGKFNVKIRADQPVDVAYFIDQNTWNGKTTLQLKIKDIRFP